MTDDRCGDYLRHMREATEQVASYLANMDRDAFFADKRTQQAVIMNLIIIGEAATRLMDDFPEYTDRHSGIPWRAMRGMRNRMAHGYFDIDLDLVWETTRTALPQLFAQLSGLF